MKPVVIDGKVQPVQGLNAQIQQASNQLVQVVNPGPKITKVRKVKDPNAPKRPRGRPRKDGTIPPPRTMDQGASDSDSDSDELQIEAEEPMPLVLRGSRPTELTQQARFDVATILWFPRNRPAVVERVQKAIAAFGDIVKKHRDAWKVKNEALKQAELASSPQVANLKLEVSQYRTVIETISQTAVELGHPSHLAKYVFFLTPRL